MWANAVLFWSVLAFFDLVYLTIRNIVWATSHGRPWLRYALPLASVFAFVIFVLVMGSRMSKPHPIDPYLGR
jgi:hypothetical protein